MIINEENLDEKNDNELIDIPLNKNSDNSSSSSSENNDNNNLEFETININETTKLQKVKISNSKNQNLQIKITSDFFLNGYPHFINKKDYIKEISRVHILLNKMNKKYYPKDIKYKLISKQHLSQLMTLYHETCPIENNIHYFKKFISSKNHFSIGAFIKINSEEFLIGFILSHLTSERKFIQHCQYIIRNKNCFSKIKDCFKTTSDKFAYLPFICVIDEYRREKIGTELLNKMIIELKRINVIGIFIHLIEHNISAIKFFEMNNWIYGGVVFNYYNFDKYYDGQVYYKLLNFEYQFQQVEIRGLNEEKIDRENKIIKILKRIIKFIMT
jgi:ribosomal protein S18 acetylase RimI-like enzyme